jgi:site-specific DNA recombinase
MQHATNRSPRLCSVDATRAALYARVSTDRQAEQHTIDSQVHDLLARAAADGHDITEGSRFLDDGVSGAGLVRPALERLRDMAALGAIDVVYVHAPDRLARSYAHQAVLIEELTRAGTRIIFLNRPLGQSPEDDLLLQVQGMFAEYERARLLERSRRGKRHLAQAGAISVLSRAPYGYRYVDRGASDGVARFEVADDRAAVVRQIFHWVGREQVTLSGVCRRLLEMGVPSPAGKKRWSRSVIADVLKNSAYAGEAVFGKHANVPWRPPLRPARGRTRVPRWPLRQVLAPPEQWVRIPVPALVERELFDCVQEQLVENRRRRRERLAGASYLLQGLLVCGHCGYAFCGTCSRRFGGARVRYYRCSGSMNHRSEDWHGCTIRSVRVEELDAAVWAEVRCLLADPAHVLHEHQRRLAAAQTSPRQLELAALERQGARVRQGIGRLIDSYTEGLIEKGEFEPRLAELRRRAAKLEAEVAAIQETAEQTRSLQLVIGKLEAFSSLLENRLVTADWAMQRDLVRTLVRRVEIHDDVVRVIFHVDPGPDEPGGSRRPMQHCPVRDRKSYQRVLRTVP